MEKLIYEIKCKTDLINFLRSSKYSKGLNSHDIKIYEKAKDEVKILNEKLEEKKKDKGMQLVLSKNITLRE